MTIKSKQEPLTITFEGYMKNNKIYIFIEKDKWDVIQDISTKHHLLVEAKDEGLA